MFLDVVDNYPMLDYNDVFPNDDVQHVIHLVFAEDWNQINAVDPQLVVVLDDKKHKIPIVQQMMVERMFEEFLVVLNVV